MSHSFFFDWLSLKQSHTSKDASRLLVQLILFRRCNGDVLNDHISHPSHLRIDSTSPGNLTLQTHTSSPPVQNTRYKIQIKDSVHTGIVLQKTTYSKKNLSASRNRQCESQPWVYKNVQRTRKSNVFVFLQTFTTDRMLKDAKISVADANGEKRLRIVCLSSQTIVFSGFSAFLLFRRFQIKEKNWNYS